MIKITGNTFPVKDQLKAMGGRWNGGERCWEVPDDKAEQARKLVGPTPMYNSPPPVDLGTTDPVAMAKRFGRTAVAGAEVVSFDVYGLAKGQDPEKDGLIRWCKVKGRRARYVQVAHSARRYYSRDMLEDFDLFDAQPGGHYQWDGIEVEPTEAERAEDQVKADCRAVHELAKAEAKAKADAEQAERLAAWRAAVDGLVSCTIPPVGFAETTERLEIDPKGNDAVKVTLADGRVGWRQSITGGDDWRTYWWLPVDAVASACLAYAAEQGITAEKAAEWLAKYKGCHGSELYQAIADADDATKAELVVSAGRKQAAELAQRWEDERRTARSSAESKLTELGWIEPSEQLKWNAPKNYTGARVASWEIRIDEIAFAPYVEHLASGKSPYDRIQAQGVTLVLKFPAEAFEATKVGRKTVPAFAGTLPTELKLHNFLTATLVIERA